MKRSYLPWLSFGVLASLGGAAWLTGVSPSRPATAAVGGLSSSGRVASEEQHFVTPEQLAESASGSHGCVQFASAITAEGSRTSWRQLSAGRPLVVVFLRDGCPCSVKFEPLFQRLARAHHSHVQFVGVIDGDVETARRFACANHVPYPILADADKSLIRLFQAKNAAYVALVDRNGFVDTLWPGCSADMMRELNARAANLAGVAEPPFDARDMPGPLTTGCPF
jgi:peroxiredoxin